MHHAHPGWKYFATAIIALQAVTLASTYTPAYADEAQAATPVPATRPETATPAQPAKPAPQDCCPECNCDMPQIDPDP